MGVALDRQGRHAAQGGHGHDRPAQVAAAAHRGVGRTAETIDHERGAAATRRRRVTALERASRRRSKPRISRAYDG